MLENNILPRSENLTRKDLFVEDLYKIESQLEPQEGKYRIKILEFEQEHSYFSNFELIKVIHPKILKAGTVNDKITFYKNIKKPEKITDSKGKDLTKAISGGDTFRGKNGDNLKIKFKDVGNKENILAWKASLRAGYPRVDSIQKAIQKLRTPQQMKGFLEKMTSVTWKSPGIFCLSLCFFCHSSCKTSIIFYLYSPKEKAEKIGMTHPREISSTGSMEIPPSFVKKESSSLELGLEWTNTHKLDYICLAQPASPEEVKSIRIENLKVESLRHSRHKEISKADLEKGKVELKPVQFLELEFPYKKTSLKPQETVSYFLKSKGYYKKLAYHK